MVDGKEENTQQQSNQRPPAAPPIKIHIGYRATPPDSSPNNQDPHKKKLGVNTRPETSPPGSAEAFYLVSRTLHPPYSVAYQVVSFSPIHGVYPLRGKSQSVKSTYRTQGWGSIPKDATIRPRYHHCCTVCIRPQVPQDPTKTTIRMYFQYAFCGMLDPTFKSHRCSSSRKGPLIIVVKRTLSSSIIS